MNLREKLKKRKADLKREYSVGLLNYDDSTGRRSEIRNILSLLDEHPLLEDMKEACKPDCPDCIFCEDKLCPHDTVSPKRWNIPAIAAKIKEWREGK